RPSDPPRAAAFLYPTLAVIGLALGFALGFLRRVTRTLPTWQEIAAEGLANQAQAVANLRQRVKSLRRTMRAAAHRHIVDALGNPTLPRGGGKCEGSRAEFIPVGGIDEQAREAARRSGRATATPAVAWETGWPARPAVARQAGQPARAEANHVADAAWAEPLTSDLRWSGAPSRLAGRRRIS